MHISLPPECEAYIEDRVTSGEFASAEEVIADALQARMSAALIADVEARLAKSKASYADGNYEVADDAFFERKISEIKERYRLG